MQQSLSPDQQRDDLLRAAQNAAATIAAATIAAVYQWADQVHAAGGPTCISGIAACKAMLDSLNKNRERCDTLIIALLRAAIEQAEGAGDA